jgi:VWFA-related protein
MRRPGVEACARRAGSPRRAALALLTAALAATGLDPGLLLATGAPRVGLPGALSATGRPVTGRPAAGAAAPVQSPSPSVAAQEARPAFRTATVLVEVDVTVHDRQGRFVDNLGPADFTIYDDGVPHGAERVLLVRAREAASSPRRSPAGPASPAPLVSVPRVIVLVVDDAHLSPGAFLRVRRAAMAFLADLAPEDVAGVVVSGRMAGGRLTTDKAALRAALAAAAPSSRVSADAGELRDWPRLSSVDEAFRIVRGDAEALNLVAARACDDEPEACRRGRETVEMEVRDKSRQVAAAHQDRARASLRVWQAVADGLQTFDGPKTVVLLTEGFAIGDEADAVRRLVDAAWRGRATFYAVDARGAGRDREPDLEATDAAVVTPGGEAAAWQAAEDSLDAVAADTGGYVVRHTNDIAGALAGIVRDRSACYVVAYSPSNPAADGTWRRLRVEVARAHITVRARRGYVAPAAPRLVIAPAAAGVAGAGGVEEGPARESREAGPAARPEAGTGAPGAGAMLDAQAGAGDPAAIAAPRGGAAGKAGTVAEVDRPAGRPAEVSPPTREAPPPGATVPGASAAADVSSLRLRPGSSERIARLAAAGASSDTTRWTPAAEREARIGWAAYERGDVEEARRHLEAAAAPGHAPPWVHYALGQAAFATGGAARAAAAWERVRTAAPEFKPVYFDLVDAHLRMGQSLQALRVLAEAARRWPDDPDVLNATGVIHLARGSVEAAVRAFERAVAVRPDEALGHFNLGRAYEVRFVRSVRLVQASRQWYRDEDARQRAATHYRRHIELGGAFARQAQEGLDRLAWVPRRPGG